MINALLTSRQGAVMTVTMNRPDQLNILGEPGDGDAFRKVFDAINEDRSIKCVIFTGAGRAFSAGGNVKDMRDRENLFAGSQADIADNYRNNVHEIVRSIWHCAVPVIAAVNGPAVGLGHDVSGLCDIRLAAQSARFGSTFLKIGLIPGDGGSWILPQNIGASRAAEMLYTSRIIDAETALSWGLVSEVYPSEELMAAAEKLAAKIISQPTAALRATKRLLRSAKTPELDAALEMAAVEQAKLHATDDHLEAVTAFIEKRPPQFTDS